MRDNCILKIGEQIRTWEYDLPAFLLFLIDENFFYKKLVGKGNASYEDVGYTSNCGKALERLNQLGFDWKMMENVYEGYYSDLYEDFKVELEYHVTSYYTDWEFDTQEDYIDGYLARLLKLSRLEQLKDFSAFYVPMLMANAGEESFMIKSIDGRLYNLKKKEHKDFGYELDTFLFDRYIGLPPWILLIGRLFSSRSNWNSDEVISAMDIKFLLEWYPPETKIDLNLTGLIKYYRETDRLHLRLTKKLINKVNLYNNFLTSVIENDTTVRDIHLKKHVKDILENIADRGIANDLKGKALEELMNFIFSAVNGFGVVENRLSLGDEEIDLLLKNDIDRPFWISFGSPFIFVECKNWSKKVGTREFRDFEGKLRNHRVGVKIGFFISYMGFSADVETALQRSSRDDIHIVLIQGDDLKEFVDSDIDVLVWLEKLVTKLH